MLSLTLALCLAQLPGLEVHLTGVAKNAKGGAVLLVNGAPVYLEHLSEWPAAVVDTRVEASGELVELAYLPESTTAENGEVSQGAAAGSTQRVLRRPRWRALAAPKPAESGIVLRPTQRTGVMLAGLTLVLSGTSLGLGLSANADARALATAADPAREQRMRAKYVATGVLGGVAGATLIAAIVLLALPPSRATVAPTVSVGSSGAMVGLVAWF